MSDQLTIGTQISQWEWRLRDANIECPAIESEWIYSFLTKKSRNELFFEREKLCPSTLSEAGEAIVARRLNREPLQYIFGEAPFMELELNVTPAVLIPRPETEILVEVLRKKTPLNGRILDVGTGSGAIALSAAYGRKDVSVTALDISLEALKVANLNCEKYHLQTQVSFRQSNLLSTLTDEVFEVVAANLPYVNEEEYVNLEPEVRCFEPKLALTANNAGLELVFRLIDQLPKHIVSNGYAIFEIGENQADKVCEYINMNTSLWRDVHIIKDYNQVARFVAMCAI